MSYVLYAILFALFCAFSLQTKPVLHNLTQFTLNEDERNVQINFTYTGPVTRLAIWNCRASPTIYLYSHDFVWRKIVEIRSKKKRSNYVYTIEGPELGETCYRVCSGCDKENEVWSNTKYISVLTYEEDESLLFSHFRFTRKQLDWNTPYITHVRRLSRGSLTKFRINFTFKSAPAPWVMIFVCNYTLEPFKFRVCKRLTRVFYNFQGSYHKDYSVLDFASGKLAIQVCTKPCSPVYFFETIDMKDDPQRFPFVMLIYRPVKVGVTNRIIVHTYYDEAKTEGTWLYVYAGYCHKGYNAIATPLQWHGVDTISKKKTYNVAFNKLDEGLWCFEACDGRRNRGRCSYPFKFANFDGNEHLQGFPRVIKAVKKSRFGYSSEVDVTYAIPLSILSYNSYFTYFTCQFVDVPFRVYNYDKVDSRILTKSGGDLHITMDKMPAGQACVTVCGYYLGVETCSEIYRIDNRLQQKAFDGALINGVKKYTKFRYSNNINVFWHFSKEMSSKYDAMRIYTCQYSILPLTTRNYTSALQLKTDKNRVNYKFEIYNLPIGRVCLALCGVKNSAESCLSLYKFNNTLESNLHLQKSLPRIIGMKRKVKYGYSSGLMLEIELSPSIDNRKFDLVIHRCEYSLYPRYQTYNYTESSRVEIKSVKKANPTFEVEGMAIGSACVQLCVEERYTDMCGVPFRVKNSRFGDESDYSLNRPQVIHVDRGVVEFMIPEVLHAEYNTIAVYRCRFRDNPLRTYDYSLSMEFTVTDYVKTHTVMLLDDYTENSCVQICVMNGHFEKCGMPYKIK